MIFYWMSSFFTLLLLIFFICFGLLVLMSKDMYFIFIFLFILEFLGMVWMFGFKINLYNNLILLVIFFIFICILLFFLYSCKFVLNFETQIGSYMLFLFGILNLLMEFLFILLIKVF